MSKTKPSGPGHYEILFIISNKHTEEEAKKIVTNVQEIITKRGSEITYNEYWGKKKFAYPINHLNHGYYALFEFDSDRKNLIAIDTDLRMSSEVLRHQIIVMKKRSSEEIQKQKEISEELLKQEREEADEKEDKKDEVKKKAVKKESIKSVEKEEKPKVDLKDLDKKLDGILDTKDLL